jgi:methionyl-tRNA synthetase
MAQHLITSAPPYVTGANYLEHLAGGMLPADIYARYLRQCGHQVLFVCATDEHGAQAELAAADAGLPVAQYCTRQHRLLEELGQRFLLSWDHFGRSSSAENHELTQHFADSLDRNGFLEERETELFLRQSEFTDVLPDEVGTASGGRWLDANLQDRCMTSTGVSRWAGPGMRAKSSTLVSTRRSNT